MNEAQNHPLYSTDREHIDRLFGKDEPGAVDFVELARLIIRYEDFDGANDLITDMEKILKKWNLNREELEIKTRNIWSSGFRPSNSNVNDNVGSGFDTSDSSSS